MSETITASPLTWPEGWKRTDMQQHSNFSRKAGPYTRRNITVSEAVTFVLDELHRMGIPDYKVIISTNLKLRNDGLPLSNQKAPYDSGVSVWWKDGGSHKVIAIDKYYTVADNIYAIGKTIEAMRGIERWGSGEILERTFTGFIALPPQGRPWRQVLGYPEGNDLNQARILYRRAMTKQHPDRGGNDELAAELNNAWEKAKAELAQ